MKLLQLKPKRLYCLVVTMLFLNSLSAQNNYSGLLNKELAPDLSKEQLIGGLLDRLLYGGNFTGSVTTVKVLDDRDVSLTVGINYVGYKEGFIHVSLVDENLNILPSFPSRKIAIDKDKKDVELKLDFDRKGYPENQPFNAPMLVVLVSKNDKGTHGIRSVYKLNKKFNNPLSPENIIVPVALVPVGSAASLPATLPTTGEPRILLPNKNIYESIKSKQVFLYKTDTAALRVKPEAMHRMGAARTTDKPAERTAVGADTRTVSVLHAPVLFRPMATIATNPGTPQPPPSKEPQGPSDNPLSFWGDFIYSDVDFESQMKITSVSLNIYPDKNPHSGIFYYLPIAYDIKYDKEKGFAFKMDYGAVRGDGNENRVRMAGTLTSGISLYEVQFIKNLMDVYKNLNPALKPFDRPMPLPISETPVITLGDELRNFGITNVNINNASSITDPINFSWMTDGTTAAELENLLKANSGIIGKMKIRPQGTTLPVQEIPVRIRLIDENTFGRFNMTPADFRNKTWRNETPFPVRLKYLHCMIIDKNREGKESPIIYSWDLGNTPVLPQNQVKFNAAAVPQWLDNHKGKQARIWLDYSVVDTCSPCNQKAFEEIISSLTRLQLSDVVFRMIPFFEEHKVAYMDVEMRSLQGDPTGKNVVNFPSVHITNDSTDQLLGKLHIAAGAEPSFEYRVTVVTKEGAELRSDWKVRNSLSVPFGSFQLKELFPSFNR